MDKSLSINFTAPELPKKPNLLNIANPTPSSSLKPPSSSTTSLKPDTLLNPMQKPQQLGSATGKLLLLIPIWFMPPLIET